MPRKFLQRLPPLALLSDKIAAFSGLVVDQAKHGGFRFWNVDDADKLRIATTQAGIVDTAHADAILNADVKGDSESGSVRKVEQDIMIERA